MNERNPAGGDRNEEEVWRDLVARFDGQDEAEQGTAPWPERENLRTSLHGERAPEQPHPWSGPEPGAAGPAANGLAGDPEGSSAEWPTGPVFGEDAAFGGDAAPPPADAASFPADAAPLPGDGASLPGDGAPDGDHFIPPPPPPLPQLQPVVKGAWLALFGGPLYLLVATAAGWTVPGWAAFCAMAAFVAGFVVLVLHLGNDRRDNGSGSDDGAVV